MKLSISDQVILGLILSMATALGIHSQSMETAVSVLIVGCFIMAPTFLGRGMASARPNVRRAAGIGGALWGAALIFGLVAMAERFYYVNGDSYPRWLAAGEVTAGETLQSFRSGRCEGKSPVEIKQMADGTFLLRCGLIWPDSKTYIAQHWSIQQ